MNYLLLQYLGYFLQICIMHTVIFLFLKPKYSVTITFTLFIIQAMSISILSQLLREVSLIFILFGYVTSIITIYYLFIDPPAKKIIIGVLFQLIQVAMEVIGVAIALKLNFNITILVGMERVKLIYFGVLLMMIIVTAIWIIVPNVNKKMKTELSTNTLMKFLLFPVSQFLLVWCVMMQFFFNDFNTIIMILICSVAVAIISDLYMFNNMIEVEKRYQADQQIKSLEFMNYIQNQEYSHLVESTENIQKLKHDYNNFLSSALNLIEQDDKSANVKGINLIQQLLNRISKSHKIYCQNQIVNAVLNEKANVCDGYEIQLKCNVNVPNEIKVNTIHLCSIFSNLLDNAIQAVLDLPNEKRIIEITALIENNFLIIKTNNEYIKKDTEDRPHLGLSILNKIAHVYDGELTVMEQGNEFNLMMCLNLTD